nr:Ty3/gypsy retrotransposon protein [Tanacetum cinerariifolium]
MFADNDPTHSIPAPQYLTLSLAAFLGLASPKALRITANIMGHPVTVLVDSGSTHNIIQPRIASFLKLPVTPIPSFPVMVGNGNHIHCDGFCQTVVLNLQNTSFTIPFFVLPIEGVNVVLGMSWLGSLGPILADFSIPQISFKSNGLTITLMGEPLTTPASPSTIQHLMQKEVIASMHTLIFQYENSPLVQNPTPPEDPHIQNLLTAYSHIFEPPTSLPPSRIHDHHIPLKPNTPPVNVKPYRYPHYQKQIMTDLIADMLKDGLIKPSHSPYSSPVLYEKVKAIQEWPRPSNVTGLRGFLGLTGYYRRFVSNYAHIASPLTDLLQKSKFEWNDEAQEAFDILTKAMMTLPVLALPDFSLIFDITTDASGTGIGAVLSQQDKPIAFFSKKLSPRTGIGAVLSQQDKPIAFFSKKLSPRMRSASTYIHALSRIEESQLLSLSTPIFPWLQELRDYYSTTPEGREFVTRVAQRVDALPDHHIHDGAIEMTPFQALYGRPPPSLPRYTLGSSQVASIDATLVEHERVISLLKDTLIKTRQRMTDQANKHRVDKDFEVGELVYLRLRVYRQTSIARRDVHKLNKRFFDPSRTLLGHSTRISHLATLHDHPSHRPRETPSTTTKPPLLTTPPKQPQTLPYTRLSAEALQQRRAAGLCFRCPERYHPGHKCNPPQFLLIVDNDDSLETPIPETTIPILSDSEHTTSTHLMFADNDPTHTIPAPQYLSLSLAAFLGLASPKALHITANIMGHPVTVLVDSGSTHNIIQPHIASFLKLPVTPIPSFPVMVGNGNHIHCDEFCQTVVLNLQNTSFTIPFFVLPIEGANVVLEVHYLRYVISESGVATEYEKVKAIQEWPRPSNVTGLRGFLGLTGYYRRFVSNYAHIASLLTDLLQKSKFEWNDEAQEAFDILKKAMMTLHVLALPDFSLIFDVTTDASGTGIGAVLSQQDKPIAFFSKKLSPRMRSASTYIRELYAITEAVKKWRHYLPGHQYKWASKLLGYDFEVHYKPGKENHVADALSRIEESQLLSLSTPIFPWLQELRDYYSTTPEGREFVTRVAQRVDALPDHHIHDGLVYIRDRLFIPDIPSLRLKLLNEFHSTTIGGHSGITATIKRISGSFSWPHLRKDVTRFIHECTICQQTKYSRQKPYGLLQTLPIPNQVWEEISMDFITNLPHSNGKSAI